MAGRRRRNSGVNNKKSRSPFEPETHIPNVPRTIVNNIKFRFPYIWRTTLGATALSGDEDCVWLVGRWVVELSGPEVQEFHANAWLCLVAFARRVAGINLRASKRARVWRCVCFVCRSDGRQWPEGGVGTAA